VSRTFRKPRYNKSENETTNIFRNEKKSIRQREKSQLQNLLFDEEVGFYSQEEDDFYDDFREINYQSEDILWRNKHDKNHNRKVQT